MGMEVTAVRLLSKVEQSKRSTAKIASARIPRRKAKHVTKYAVTITSAMVTATTRTTIAAAITMRVIAAVPMSRKLTATSANARIRNTNPVLATPNADKSSTRVTGTATTTTTTVAANSMEATAVRLLSQVEQSKRSTAKSASARIPRRKAKDVTKYARLKITSAMVTATTRITIAAAITIKVIAAVPMSRNLTARSANARIRITNPVVATANADNRSTRVTGTATTTTTTVVANSMEVTAVRLLSLVEQSKRSTATIASARIPRRKAKHVTKHAVKITSAMVTATTRTIIAAAITMRVIAAVPMSRNLTARNANAKTPNSRKSNTVFI